MGGRGREGMDTANDRAEIDDKREAAVAAAAAARACMIQFSAFLEPRQQAVSDAETAFQLSRYAIKVAICWLWWATQRRQQHEHQLRDGNKGCRRWLDQRIFALSFICHKNEFISRIKTLMFFISRIFVEFQLSVFQVSMNFFFLTSRRCAAELEMCLLSDYAVKKMGAAMRPDTESRSSEEGCMDLERLVIITQKCVLIFVFNSSCHALAFLLPQSRKQGG